MGVSQSVALANGTGRAAVERAGIKVSRVPLRLNLSRQYAVKEYLEVHGGHGPNANYKQILGGLGIAFALTSVWTMLQKAVFNHDVPSTITPAHEAAAHKRASELQHDAITKHRIGKKVDAHIVSAEAQKQEVADEIEKLK